MKSRTAKCLLIGLSAGFFVTQSSASLLVYEGFSGYNTGVLTGQTAQGTGLTSQWSLRGNTDMNVTSTGLTFGSLTTSGGAASVSLSGSNDLSVMGVEVDLDSPATGTVYSSMLFNFSSVADSGSLSGLRVSDNIGLQDNNRFSIYPVYQGTTGYYPGVAYNLNSTRSDQTLSLDTTYIAITILERVGEDTNLPGDAGRANLYVLDELQFEDFVANGRDEANLTGRTIGAGAGNVSAFATHGSRGGPLTFADGDFLGFASFANSGTLSGIYDELRWGTSLDDVTVVPEPASLAFLLSMGMFCSVLIRRRR